MYVVAHNGARIWGGAERATALLLSGLQARGHRVLLLCNDPLVRDETRRLGVPAEIGRLGGDAAVHDAGRMALRLRRERPDALLIGTFKKMWLAALAARLAGVPRVVARIGLETDVPRNRKYRWVLARRWVDAVTVNAAAMRAPFLALPGWTADRVVTLYNGVLPAPEGAVSSNVREKLGIPSSARVVGAVARLSRQKRFDRLLRALAMLDADVHCLLAGEGAERVVLEELANELEIGPRVHFVGYRRDTAAVLAALDLYVVTSDREGMSNAMLEAMMAGVPVLSTPVSGAAEALEPLPDGRLLGVVTRSFAVAEIASEISLLLASGAVLDRIGAAARERAETRFSFEGMIRQWEAVLGAGGKR